MSTVSEGVSPPMYGTGGGEVPAAAGFILTGEHGGAQGVSGHKGRRQRGQPGQVQYCLLCLYALN